MSNHTLADIRNNTTLTTDSATEPVSVAEAKSWLRVTHASEDALITSLIKTARRSAERYTARAFIDQSWTMYLDRFPGWNEIPLKRSPLSSVTTIKYKDEDDVLQTLSNTQYIVSKGNEKPGKVALVEEADDWPDTLNEIDAVEIEYIAGYGATSADVPDTIKTAILFSVAHFFENREAVTVGVTGIELPMGVKSLLYHERIMAGL